MRVPGGGVVWRCIVRRTIKGRIRRSRGAEHALRCAASQKRAQRGQVLPVRLVLDFLRRFEQLGDAPEARVVEDVAESVDADLTLANVLVAVDARAERLLRVVEVEGAALVDVGVALDLCGRALPA